MPWYNVSGRGYDALIPWNNVSRSGYDALVTWCNVSGRGYDALMPWHNVSGRGYMMPSCPGVAIAVEGMMPSFHGIARQHYAVTLYSLYLYTFYHFILFR